MSSLKRRFAWRERPTGWRRSTCWFFVRPELVVEVVFSDVQASSQYPGGVALRFARVKRYRPDKSAADADTIDAVRAIHAQSTGWLPEGRLIAFPAGSSD